MNLLIRTVYSFVSIMMAASVAFAGTIERPPQTLERELPASQRAGWREVIRWPDDCEDAFRATTGERKSGIVFHDLGQGHRLAQITCAPGAYQGYYVFADVAESRKGMTSRLLTFPLFASPDGKKIERQAGEEVWGTVTFDSRSRTLTVLNRFRGPGDCGSYVVYRFRDGIPVVDKALAKPQCDGHGAEHPERWPRIK